LRLHVGHQRRPLGVDPAAFEKAWQGHAGHHHRRRLDHRLLEADQQGFQALPERGHVQRLGQKRGRRQWHRLAHAGAVDLLTEQNERQCRLAAVTAHTAQQIQAIEAAQLAGGNHQVRVVHQLRHGLQAGLADVQLGVRAHAAQQLGERIARVRVAIDDQNARYMRCGGSIHLPLLGDPYKPGRHFASWVQADSA
jgi:hypothetical protein